MLKKINCKQAKELTLKLGCCWFGETDGKTFYATNEYEDEIYEYDSKRERDDAVERSKRLDKYEKQVNDAILSVMKG